MTSRGSRARAPSWETAGLSGSQIKEGTGGLTKLSGKSPQQKWRPHPALCESCVGVSQAGVGGASGFQAEWAVEVSTQARLGCESFDVRRDGSDTSRENRWGGPTAAYEGPCQLCRKGALLGILSKTLTGRVLWHRNINLSTMWMTGSHGSETTNRRKSIQVFKEVTPNQICSTSQSYHLNTKMVMPLVSALGGTGRKISVSSRSAWFT